VPQGKGALLNLGALPPKRPRFKALGPEWMDDNEGTRAEGKATQSCDPSADSSAGMAGAAPVAPNKIRPAVHNLLDAKNGLDNGVHFHRQRFLKIEPCQ